TTNNMPCPSVFEHHTFCPFRYYTAKEQHKRGFRLEWTPIRLIFNLNGLPFTYFPLEWTPILRKHKPRQTVTDRLSSVFACVFFFSRYTYPPPGKNYYRRRNTSPNSATSHFSRLFLGE